MKPGQRYIPVVIVVVGVGVAFVAAVANAANVVAGVVATVVAVVANVVAAAGVVALRIQLGRLQQGKGRQQASGRRGLRIAGGLLPVSVRDEYCEEWACWLDDLRADGAPWYRRLAEVISILLNVPRLAFTEWANGRKAVE